MLNVSLLVFFKIGQFIGVNASNLISPSNYYDIMKYNQLKKKKKKIYKKHYEFEKHKTTYDLLNGLTIQRLKITVFYIQIESNLQIQGRLGKLNGINSCTKPNESRQRR